MAMCARNFLQDAPIGFGNGVGDNTCFINSTSQAVIRDPVISQALEHSVVGLNVVEARTVWQCLQQICHFSCQGFTSFPAQPIMQLVREEQGSFLTLDSHGRPALMQDQHCWADALQALLQLMLMTMPPGYKAILEDTFTIYLQSFFNCGEEDCKRSRCLGTPEPCFILHVPCLAASSLKGSLDALLLAEKTSEPLTCCQGDEASNRVHGSRCYRLARPPPTLIINLKRATSDNEKSGKAVTYPMELDMGKYCAAHTIMEGWSFKYRLGGAILHLGHGNSGHYVILQCCSDGQWLIRDDLYTLPVLDPLIFKQTIVGLFYYSIPNKMGPSMSSMPPMLEGFDAPPDLSVFNIHTPLTTAPAPAIQRQLQLLEQQNQERMTAQRRLAAQRAEHEAQARATAEAKRKAAADAQQQAERQAAAAAERKAQRKAAAEAEQRAHTAAITVIHQVEAERQQQMLAEQRQAAHMAWQEAKKKTAAGDLQEGHTQAVALPQQMAARQAIVEAQAARQRALHLSRPEANRQCVPSSSAEAQQQAGRQCLVGQVHRAEAQEQAGRQAQAQVLPQQGVADQAVMQYGQPAVVGHPCEPWWTRLSDRNGLMQAHRPAVVPNNISANTAETSVATNAVTKNITHTNSGTETDPAAATAATDEDCGAESIENKSSAHDSDAEEEPEPKHKRGIFGRAVSGLKGFVRNHPGATGAVLAGIAGGVALVAGGRRGGPPAAEPSPPRGSRTWSACCCLQNNWTYVLSVFTGHWDRRHIEHLKSTTAAYDLHAPDQYSRQHIVLMPNT